MADGSIIGLELHLNGKEQVKKDLQEIFKYAEENKNIKLDIDSNVLNSILEVIIISELCPFSSTKLCVTLFFILYPLFHIL